MKRRGSIRYLISEGFRNLHVNRLMSVASVAVLVACLVMIGSAVLLFLNVDVAVEKVGQQNIIMVFVEDTADETSRETNLSDMQNKLQMIDNISDITLVRREEGFEDILDDLEGNASVLSEADSSFLPDAFRITVKDMNLFNDTVNAVAAVPGILHVRQNSDLAYRLQHISQAITYISLGIIVLLLLVALFIIANTIRITMHSRRLEISIMKAVGATNWFIRTPFLVEGIVLGTIAAILSLGLLFALYTLAGTALQNVFSIFNSDVIPFANYVLPIFGGFLAISVITGGLGSIFSIGKYLKEQGGVVLNEEE